MARQGAGHEFTHNVQIYLSVDLCPSHKPMDRELFDKIKRQDKAVPIGIAISGGWLKSHREDFASLQRLEANETIKITWINHSYSHPYTPGIPNKHNFVLSKNVDFANEVFENERLLLENGVLPTVFFRFPGLISEQREVLQLRSWGLIPIATDAWLAEGEKVHPGSVILVHANGNEPLGLQRLYQLLVSWPEMRYLFAELRSAFWIHPVAQ